MGSLHRQFAFSKNYSTFYLLLNIGISITMHDLPIHLFSALLHYLYQPTTHYHEDASMAVYTFSSDHISAVLSSQLHPHNTLLQFRFPAFALLLFTILPTGSRSKTSKPISTRLALLIFYWAILIPNFNPTPHPKRTYRVQPRESAQFCFKPGPSIGV